MCLPGGVCDDQRNMIGRRTGLLLNNPVFLALVAPLRHDHVPHHCATVPDGCASSHCTKKHLPGERQHQHEDEVEDPVPRDIPNANNHITHKETKKRKAHPNASEAFTHHHSRSLRGQHTVPHRPTNTTTLRTGRRMPAGASRQRRKPTGCFNVHRTGRSATMMYLKARPDPATAHENPSDNKQRNKEGKSQPKRFRGVYPPPQ